MNAMNYEFTGATTFAAENASDNAGKRELTPLQQGLVTVAGVGLTVTAVGVGLYWANKGIKATADNIGAAADGIKAAHERHEQKKLEKAQQLLNQGNA